MTNNQQIVALSLTTQRVRNYIFLAQMVMNFLLVVLDQLESSSMPYVQVWLCEDVLQTLVVHINVNHIPR
jgi:hypothetical protein